MSARLLRKYVHAVMEQLPPLRDALPRSVREPLKLPLFWDALIESHFPPAGSDVRALNQFRSAAQYRLIFEEFFWLECGLILKRRRARRERGISFSLNDRVREQIKKMLPFRPTGAQKRVLGEIAADMKDPSPMLRMLQGDVGSGKTLVAAEAAIIAMENRYQVAVLAPTEILAPSTTSPLSSFWSRSAMKSCCSPEATRETKKQKKLGIETGFARVVVGTHAILQEGCQL